MGGLAIMICVIGLFYACQWGIASAAYAISMQYLKNMQASAGVYDHDTRHEIEYLMGLSTRLDRKNANYFNASGQMFDTFARAAEISKNERNMLLVKAVKAFREASRLRPVWPVPWANLALVKSELYINDAEYTHALEQAMLLGESQPVLHDIVTEAALIQWPRLSGALRVKVVHQIEVGLHGMYRGRVFNVIQAHDMCRELIKAGILFHKKRCAN